jgi:5-methylcytosine-specific restriction enzyme A
VWAGWYENTGPSRIPFQNSEAAPLLVNLTNALRKEGDVEILKFERAVLSIDEENAPCPFISTHKTGGVSPPGQVKTTQKLPTPKPKNQNDHNEFVYGQRTDEEIVDSLFGEDVSAIEKQPREVVVRVRQRNRNAVKDLKELYRHTCQISGSKNTFKKRDGIPYTEVHHLIPLGDGGADNPKNMIVVSPIFHRMLHYANVEGIDLGNITPQPNGTSTLKIEINGDEAEITWQAEHANRILRWNDPK